jgi:flavin-dependent dehydrogenase
MRPMLGYLPEDAVLHTTSQMAVNTGNGRVTIRLHDPDLIIERNQLTLHLRDRAVAAGVAIHYGHRFLDLRPHPAGAELHMQDAAGASLHIPARAVIGADGAFSAVAAAAHLQRPPTVPIIQAEVRLPSGWNSDVTQVWFHPHQTRFFFWLIPESDTHGVVGLVGENRSTTPRLLQAFLEEHNIQPLRYQASRVALYHPRLSPHGQVGRAPVLLVGDAAGQVKVTTVGGTVSGFWGARAAVSALLDGTNYAAELRPLKWELNLHWMIRLLLERLDNTGYDQLVDCINHPVQQFLSRYNRDDMAQHIWQMAFLQPRFIPLALRLLLRRKHQYSEPAVASLAETRPS